MLLEQSCGLGVNNYSRKFNGIERIQDNNNERQQTKFVMGKRRIHRYHCLRGHSLPNVPWNLFQLHNKRRAGCVSLLFSFMLVYFIYCYSFASFFPSLFASFFASFVSLVHLFVFCSSKYRKHFQSHTVYMYESFHIQNIYYNDTCKTIVEYYRK